MSKHPTPPNEANAGVSTDREIDLEVRLRLEQITSFIVDSEHRAEFRASEARRATLERRVCRAAAASRSLKTELLAEFQRLDRRLGLHQRLRAKLRSSKRQCSLHQKFAATALTFSKRTRTQAAKQKNPLCGLPDSAAERVVDFLGDGDNRRGPLALAAASRGLLAGAVVLEAHQIAEGVSGGAREKPFGFRVRPLISILRRGACGEPSPRSPRSRVVEERNSLLRLPPPPFAMSAVDSSDDKKASAFTSSSSTSAFTSSSSTSTSTSTTSAISTTSTTSTADRRMFPSKTNSPLKGLAADVVRRMSGQELKAVLRLGTRIDGLEGQLRTTVHANEDLEEKVHASERVKRALAEQVESLQRTQDEMALKQHDLYSQLAADQEVICYLDAKVKRLSVGTGGGVDVANGSSGSKSRAGAEKEEKEQEKKKVEEEERQQQALQAAEQRVAELEKRAEAQAQQLAALRTGAAARCTELVAKHKEEVSSLEALIKVLRRENKDLGSKKRQWEDAKRVLVKEVKRLRRKRNTTTTNKK